MQVFGIANCDTVKKAKKWLDAQAIAYEFIDFKKSPPTEEQVNRWIAQFGIEKVINKRGTTYRKLTDEQKSALENGNAVTLLCEFSSMIKRPIVESANINLIGFAEADWLDRLK